MPYVITIVAYLVVLLSVGIFLASRAKSQEGFMVANRQLTAPVLVATLLATWIGSGDVFSVSDLSYHHGYSSLIGSAGGWVGIIVVYFIAARVRRFGQFTHQTFSRRGTTNGPDCWPQSPPSSHT